MKSCVIFGAGVFGKLAYECLKDRYQILAYLDNDVKKQGSYLNGLRILPPRSRTALRTAMLWLPHGFRFRLLTN